MKQFNLLKEVHGIRARLMGLNYQPERRVNKNNVYAVFLLAIAGFILYEMYPMLESGPPPSPPVPVIDEVKNNKASFIPPAVETKIPHSEEVKDNTKNSPPPVENEDMIKSKADIVKSEIAVKDSDSPPLVKKEKERQKKVYIIRVATCVLKESADVVQRDLKVKGFSSYQETAPGYIKGKVANLHKVYVGDYNNRQDVLSVVDKLKTNGFSAIVEERENG